jgi:hypothetical protein
MSMPHTKSWRYCSQASGNVVNGRAMLHSRDTGSYNHSLA